MNRDVSDKASEKAKNGSIKAIHDDSKVTKNESDEQNHDKIEDIEVNMEDKMSPIDDTNHNTRVRNEMDTLDSIPLESALECLMGAYWHLVS